MGQDPHPLDFLSTSIVNSLPSQVRKYREMIKETMIIITTGTSETRNEEENTIAHLSHDIIFSQILNRLPSKTLVRFSCVSKLWYNTIHHDPFFIASHLNHSNSNPPSLVVIYGRGYSGTFFIYLDQVEQEEETSSSILMENLSIYARFVVGSINGLTCICTPYFIVICNPGTHEILSIPYPEQELLHSCMYGFGFDPLMNVYKVLQVDCDDSVCQIFTLGAGAQDCIWRDVNVTKDDVPLKECQAQERYCEYPFNYSSGALFKAIPLSNIIIMFDIHHEKFQVIPGLQVSTRDRFHLYSMCDFRGCPYAVYREDLVDGYEFSLYALEKQKSSSNNSYVGSNIHFVSEHAFRIPFKPTTILISFIESSEKMLLQWDQWVNIFKQLCVYNQHTERLQELKRRFLRASPLLVIKHIDSLLSLKTLVPPSTLSSKGCRHLV